MTSPGEFSHPGVTHEICLETQLLCVFFPVHVAGQVGCSVAGRGIQLSFDLFGS